MIPGTFSPSTQVGRSSSTILKYSGQRLRSSSVPRRFPARLYGWQGNPPQIRSTGWRFWAPHSRTSRNRSTLGQCLSSTLLQNSSISICHSHFIPARSRPRSKPPIPANRLPKVSGLLTTPAPRSSTSGTPAPGARARMSFRAALVSWWPRRICHHYG